MKAKIKLNRITFRVIVALALLFFIWTEKTEANKAVELHPVDPNQIPDILTMISNRTRSNYDQIKTWQGELKIISDYVYDGEKATEVFKEDITTSEKATKELLEHRETNIKFSLDVEKELLYVKYYSDSDKPLQYIDIENGRDLKKKVILATRGAILTPEYQIDFIVDTTQDGVVKGSEAVKQARSKGIPTCVGHPVLDPRIYLSIGEQTWEFFPKLVDYIREHGKYGVGRFDLQVEECKAGDTHDYRIIMPSMMQGDGNYIFNEWVFSGNDGFNVVSHQTTYQNERDANKVMFEKEMLEYKRFNNVYVPCYKLEQTFDVPSGKLKKEKKITFKNHQVNEPIPEETFTISNLGLQDGDKFVDKVAGKEFEYKNDELVELVKEPVKD